MRNCRFERAEMYEDISTLEQYQQALNKGHSIENALNVCYQYSRDNARTPMQWNGEEHAGFTNGQPWFYVNPNYREINAQKDMAAERSVFRFYKKLIALRKDPEYEEVLVTGNTRPLFTDEDHIFAYERATENGQKKVLVISNYQNCDYDLTIDSAFQKVLLNNYESLEITNGVLSLKPYQTVVLQ